MARTKRPEKAAKPRTSGCNRLAAQVLEPLITSDNHSLAASVSSSSNSPPRSRRSLPIVAPIHFHVETVKFMNNRSNKTKILFKLVKDFVKVVEHVQRDSGKWSAYQWQCPLTDCKKTLSYGRMFDILRHLVIHMPPELQPFQCPLQKDCGYAAPQYSNYLCHMRTHGLVEKLRCTLWLPGGVLCEYTANDNSQMNAHRKNVAHCDYPSWLADHYKEAEKERRGRGPLPPPPEYTWARRRRLQEHGRPAAKQKNPLGEIATRSTQTCEEDVDFAANLANATNINPDLIALYTRPTTMLTVHNPFEDSTSSGSKISVGCQVGPHAEPGTEPTLVITGRPSRATMPAGIVTTIHRCAMRAEAGVSTQADEYGSGRSVKDLTMATTRADQAINAGVENKVEELDDHAMWMQTYMDVDDGCVVPVDIGTGDAAQEGGEEAMGGLADINTDDDAGMHPLAIESDAAPTEPQLPSQDVVPLENDSIYLPESLDEGAHTVYLPRQAPAPEPFWLASDGPAQPPPRILTPLPLGSTLSLKTTETDASRKIVRAPTPPWVIRKLLAPSPSPAWTSILLDEGSLCSTPSTTTAPMISRAPTPPWLSRPSSTVSPSPLPTPSPTQTAPFIWSPAFFGPSPFVSDSALVVARPLTGLSRSPTSVLFATQSFISLPPQEVSVPIPSGQHSRPEPSCDFTGQNQWDPCRLSSPSWLSSNSSQWSRSPSPDV